MNTFAWVFSVPCLTKSHNVKQSKESFKPLNLVIQIDESKIKSHLGKVVHQTVEETLNDLLDAEADRLCTARRYE